MSSLRTVLENLTAVDGTYPISAPEGWTQGRTLYGGMTAALSAHASVSAVPDLPPLRSAQFTFMGPATGDLAFRPDLLRSGRSSTVVGVDCFSGSSLACRGTLTYGLSRRSAVDHDFQRRTEPKPAADCEPFFDQSAGRPGFFQNFEMRLASGARPLTMASKPEFEVWVRYIDEGEVDPTIALLAVADSLPPAAMVAFPSFAPISTMTWSIDIAQPVRRTEWRLLHSVSEASADGYSQQAMEVFDEDGARIAAGRQCVAIFT